MGAFLSLIEMSFHSLYAVETHFMTAQNGDSHLPGDGHLELHFAKWLLNCYETQCILISWERLSQPSFPREVHKENTVRQLSFVF